GSDSAQVACSPPSSVGLFDTPRVSVTPPWLCQICLWWCCWHAMGGCSCVLDLGFLCLIFYGLLLFIWLSILGPAICVGIGLHWK
ncbi:unnamed protein product, partial [Prunus brigantina]